MTEKKNPICCICGCECENEFGNNPWPVVKDNDARCCNRCDASVVIPARIRQAIEARRKADLKTEKFSMRISEKDLALLDEVCEATGRSRANLITELVRIAHKQLVEDKEQE